MNFFSKNLIYLRNQKGLSRSELANKLKVNQSTISRWEHGDMGVTVDNAYDVANFFDVSIADLVGKDLQSLASETSSVEYLFNLSKNILCDGDKATMEFIMKKTLNNYENSNKT